MLKCMNVENDSIGLKIAEKQTMIKISQKMNPIVLKNIIPVLYANPASESQIEKLLNKK